jgi:hypothetical protein
LIANNDSSASTPAATKPSVRHWLDLIVGGSAIVIAVISLTVALRQSHIMERQLAASVWPYLQYDTSNATLEGKPVMSFAVENVGVGPARVHSVSMRYGDKPVRDARELWTACCADLLAGGQKPAWRISTLHDQVLAPNRPKTFLLLTDDPANPLFRQRLESERQKIALRFCYCSVLDQCWMFDSEKDTLAALPYCPAQQADDYRG